MGNSKFGPTYLLWNYRVQDHIKYHVPHQLWNSALSLYHCLHFWECHASETPGVLTLLFKYLWGLLSQDDQI